MFNVTNRLAILLAAIAAWMFGAIYYGLLGKHWVDALGRTVEEFKAQQATKLGRFSAQIAFLLSFVAALVMALILSGILFRVGIFTVRAGLFSGAMCWLGFVATTMTVNNAFAGRRPMLTVIDAGHWLGALLIIGAILGGMGR